ncbi:MAG: prolyl oligopeptidase family serine peptidase [Gemmatimonadetes bacterium]|nr:prolyl oligopeptidase family serine peptidase [Gemmatimonadota bacterium]
MSDEVYGVFERFFESEPVPLEPAIEEEDHSSPHWIRQRLSFAAGYGDDRVTALLYLPKSAKPPYQTMVFMGGAGSFSQRPSTSEDLIQNWSRMEYLIRGGRAVLFPLWNGSYERGDKFSPTGSGAVAFREKTIEWVKELRQSVDYLETRDYIDPDKIGFEGTSYGALMMNGRYDPIFPYESSQLPMFEALGTPDTQKRFLTFPSGHSSYGWNSELYREGISWLDQLFGKPLR